MENSMQASPAVQVPASSANATTPAATVTKGKRKTIPRLSAAEALKLPGAIAPVVKKAEPEFVYSLLFCFPSAASGWSSVEANKVHGFASQLDVQATANGLGGVTSVSVSDGSFDVTLTLTVIGTPASDADPAAKAFAVLEELLNTVAGTPYKAKKNGTTIVPGVVPGNSEVATQ